MSGRPPKTPEQSAAEQERLLDCLARWIVFDRCQGDGRLVAAYFEGFGSRVDALGRRLPPPPISRIPGLRDRCRRVWGEGAA